MLRNVAKGGMNNDQNKSRSPLLAADDNAAHQFSFVSREGFDGIQTRRSSSTTIPGGSGPQFIAKIRHGNVCIHNAVSTA
mmetsp:Transcript_24712/g.69379  ORF Transcript_24712/g.69379 Transcript_24712/m.69379 type:complete len:80 (+) Transcript_24712:25-264(+)